MGRHSWPGNCKHNSAVFEDSSSLKDYTLSYDVEVLCCLSAVITWPDEDCSSNCLPLLLRRWKGLGVP